MKRVWKVLAIATLSLLATAILAPAAAAAEEKTVLSYSIKEARASLWQIHYPQSTFVTEKYSPCIAEDDELYSCDRTRYNQEPNTCTPDVALGMTKEAPETPTPEEAEGGSTDDGGVGTAQEWPIGNPVTVVHGLASGHMASTPESGGFSSMYYVDNSGRRETEAHVESDAFVGNRASYEERCAVVDAFSETGHYPGPFHAHVLSRATETATYNMTAFTTLEAAPPPGGNKESVSIVKLWEAGGRVHGLLTSTVRGATLGGGAIVIDAVRSVISFSSDGTEKGLIAIAKTEALGLTLGGTKIGSLDAGQIIPLGADAYLGVLRPVVQVADEGRRVTIRAPGLFLAARDTGLDSLPIPEDPFNMAPFPEQLAGQITLGGKLKPDQVVYVAGALLNAGVGRVPASDFLPGLPDIPLPQIPVINPGVITPPVIAPPAAPAAPSQPVALPRFEVRQLSGSAWPAAVIIVLGFVGLMMIMGRWTLRFAWARSLSRYPPFPAFGWVYRAFLKG
ncbi:MAG TPA: hypothetical protein VJ922_01200 [Actinomycetota bacterium]|nr:hypothetical protein [Actinomycetota bacterium]